MSTVYDITFGGVATVATDIVKHTICFILLRVQHVVALNTKQNSHRFRPIRLHCRQGQTIRRSLYAAHSEPNDSVFQEFRIKSMI